MKKVNIVYDFDGTLTQVSLPRYLILEKCNYEMGTSNEKFFQEVFGCTFKVENNKIVEIDYYLSTKEKINKLELLQKKSDTRSDKTIYVGDGLTDYYAMKYIHNNGGKTIFVHQNENDFDIYKEVNKENIVDYCEIADYNENTDLYRAIMNAIKG